jgi:hypothetical protein
MKHALLSAFVVTIAVTAMVVVPGGTALVFAGVKYWRDRQNIKNSNLTLFAPRPCRDGDMEKPCPNSSLR